MKYKYEFLKDLISEIFTKVGVDPEDANIAAQVLLRSDFTGVSSHGLSRLENYIYKIKSGKINLSPQVKKENHDEKLIRVNGDNGLGLAVGPKALQLAIDAAKEYGISCVTVNNSNHFGVGNYYGSRIAENDLIGIVVTNATPSMAPFGGIEKLLGTNPVIISIPAGKYPPIILDMATSATAYGVIEQFALNNMELESNWAMNLEGEMITDPQEIVRGNGMLMPMAKHKGYGLSLIIDLLCFALAGANFGKDVTSLRAMGDDIKPEGVGHIMIAIDVSRFGSREKFKADVDNYIEYIKASKRKKDVNEIFVPGEIEFNRLQKNLEDGIELKENVYSYLTRISREYRIINDSEELYEFRKN